ncbi:MAG: hypothetical protein K2H90_07515 [Oscillospiraceae bacterium]|nr:hypothetical protein [Oscillospiraceae bacterium]
MKISKILTSIAAAATVASMIAVSASATNWANASYADNDPNTVKVISTDENKASFTATADGTTAKLRVTVGDILEEADIANVKSASWTVNYEIPEGTAVGNGVGGGTYFGIKNSTGYWISPDYDDDGNAYWGSTTYSATDDAKFLLPTEILAADSELVFMDWSNHEAITAMTVSITDLKFFDADGNEIAQKAYEGTSAPAATETPAADNGAATTSATTGNATVASIAAVMAVAGVAAIAAKKRK